MPDYVKNWKTMLGAAQPTPEPAPQAASPQSAPAQVSPEILAAFQRLFGNASPPSSAPAGVPPDVAAMAVRPMAQNHGQDINLPILKRLAAGLVK